MLKTKSKLTKVNMLELNVRFFYIINTDDFLVLTYTSNNKMFSSLF